MNFPEKSEKHFFYIYEHLTSCKKFKKSNFQLAFTRPIDEVVGLTAKQKELFEELRKSVFSSLTAWQKTTVARHPRRPYTLDYVEELIEDFELFETAAL